MKIKNIVLDGVLLKVIEENSKRKDGSDYKKYNVNVDIADCAGTLPTTEEVFKAVVGKNYKPCKFLCEFNGDYQYGASGAFKVVGIQLLEADKGK